MRILAIAMMAIGSAMVGGGTAAIAAETGGGAADSEIDAIGALMAKATALRPELELEKARALFLEARAQAKAGAERYAADPALAARFRDLQGIATYHAAEAVWHDWDDRAARDAETVWLVEAAALLAAGVAADPKNGPHEEFRLTGERLFERGIRYADPRLADWSAVRVAANRARVAALPDDSTEKNLLAQALYDHGWLTRDAGATSEAERIVTAMDADDVTFAARDKRAAVAAGKRPYAMPGDEDW